MPKARAPDLLRSCTAWHRVLSRRSLGGACHGGGACPSQDHLAQGEPESVPMRKPSTAGGVLPPTEAIGTVQEVGGMPMKVLYVSGNIGLGHVTRDLAIAAALRARNPEVEITWLASEPALTVLRRAGEHLHPLTIDYRSDTAVADRLIGGGQLNLLDYAFGASRGWLSHALVARRLLAREAYDVVVGDETYDLVVAQLVHLLNVPAPFVMLYDFLGLDPMTTRWTERLGVYFWNLVWSLDRRVVTTPPNRAVFIGEAEDIPDTRFGPLLPHRREHAQRRYEFVGYVVPFDATTLQDRTRLRADLGYSPAPLVVCSVGGLAVGRDLLELCGHSYALLTQNSQTCRWCWSAGRASHQTPSTSPKVSISADTCRPLQTPGRRRPSRRPGRRDDHTRAHRVAATIPLLPR